MNSKWPKMMAVSAIISLWLLYDITTATETPRPALAWLQYALLGLALIALINSVVRYIRER